MPPFDPDARQQSVIDHTTGPMLVTGGFGAGKTAVLRERFARLIETGADPERVALVVGSGRARDGARTALLDRLGIALPRLTVVTIQGLAFHVVGERYEQLGYEAPPRVLSASEQRDRVRELLVHEDPGRWPAYAGLLALRGFTDEIRQFVIRAQEALLPPDDIERRATEQGLGGWSELAAFLRHYLEVLDASKEVDFAGLVEQAAAAAAASDRPFDHVIVDDYQDTTFGAERLLSELRPESLVVAGDLGAHVFGFQGTTDVPLRRFLEAYPGAARVELVARHRPRAETVEAWRAPHVSEQHAAVAREVRRIHVDEGVRWREIAIVARRHGAHEAGLLRALDDAHIPRAVSERGTYRQAAATRPFLLAFHWVVAGPEERDALIEPVLTSELGGLSPAGAKTLLREVRAHGLTPREALGRPDLAAPEEADTLAELAAVLDDAEARRASVLGAFEALWRSLPYAQGLVRRAEDDHHARLDLDAVLQLSRAASDAVSTADPSVDAFLLRLGSDEADELAAGVETAEDAVNVLTAHAVTGRGFDTVIVVDVLEGDFPSLSRPEPMFDLAALDGTRRRSETNRLRLADERRLFTMVCSRARRRVLFTATDPHGDQSGVTLRSRFVEELGVEWVDAPSTPFAEPVSVREAASAWRRILADPRAAATERLSSLDGLLTLGDDPERWWFQRDWTDLAAEPRERLYLSFSRLDTLENCELQYVLSSELGLDPGGGYQAWVGRLVHQLIEDCENGDIDRTVEAFEQALDDRWEPARFPSFAISEAERTNAKRVLIPNWFSRYADPLATATERTFEFEFDGAAIRGKIDRIGPGHDGASRITDYKTGRSDSSPRPAESLQLGIYYLAVDGCEELVEHRPVEAVELAYLGGKKKDAALDVKEWPVSRDEEEDYKTRMRTRIGGLIERIHELERDRRYVASTTANCFFCRFQPLCTRYPQGDAVFPIVDTTPPDATPAEEAAAARAFVGGDPQQLRLVT
ncbi:MAG TPA: ATP-dependent DNA helicase [Actinomycetota bacterium]|nr:ATP-dependent DNA helicase [Actinomycetota bacterium]